MDDRIPIDAINAELERRRKMGFVKNEPNFSNMQKCYALLQHLFPEEKCTMEIDMEGFNRGTITVHGDDEIAVFDAEEFHSAVRNAANFSFCACLDGTVEFSVVFADVLRVKD